jgi:DNA invertase Pin-like site-specific DNA recombinase
MRSSPCARVSTGGQTLDWQYDAPKAAGCRKIFADKKSGKNDLRPELKASHTFRDSGDIQVVPSLVRYGRSLQGLADMVPSSATAKSASRRSTRRSTPPPRAGA